MNEGWAIYSTQLDHFLVNCPIRRGLGTKRSQALVSPTSISQLTHRHNS